MAILECFIQILHRPSKVMVVISFANPDIFSQQNIILCSYVCPDSKIHVANIGPTWVLSAPGGPHVGPNEPCYQGFVAGMLC